MARVKGRSRFMSRARPEFRVRTRTMVYFMCRAGLVLGLGQWLTLTLQMGLVLGLGLRLGLWLL